MIFSTNFLKNVKIMEVGPRDGLQNESNFLNTSSKFLLISKLIDTGFSRIETTAIVNPKWIPSLSDHSDIVQNLPKKEHTKYAVLIPNLHGYNQIYDSNIDEFALVISTSNTHNLKNINLTTYDTLKSYEKIAKNAFKDKIPWRAYISCSFGCPYEGFISPLTTLNLATRLINMGAYDVSISDTIGIASPKQTSELIYLLSNKIDKHKISLHMHDTRGFSLLNIFIAMLQNIYKFDSALSGLGGCPYAPGASGNIATESVIHMLNNLGIKNGINLAKLYDCSYLIEKSFKKMIQTKPLYPYSF